MMLHVQIPSMKCFPQLSRAAKGYVPYQGRHDQELADVGIQRPCSLPHFGATLKGHTSTRAHCSIS